MNLLYFDCNMGATGNLLVSALYDLYEPKAEFLEMMNHAFLPYHVAITETSFRSGELSGRHLEITVANTCGFPETAFASYASLSGLIGTLSLPSAVKKQVLDIYHLLGDAKASVLQSSPGEVSFESLDTPVTFVSICGLALLLSRLAPDRIYAAPLNIGNAGSVASALLQGLPVFYDNNKDVPLTAEAAAILKYYVSAFDALPAITLHHSGYGIQKISEQTACYVRAFYGEMTSGEYDDRILGISCNLDDMTGEAIGFATEMILAAGALDVFATSIQMKKNRPGILLTCLCKINEKEKFTELIFRHTTTRGVRYTTYERAKLSSSFSKANTSLGTIRMKQSVGYGASHEKPEFEDLKAIALRENLSLEEVLDLLKKSIL